MNTHDIELPPLPHLPLNDPAAAYTAMYDYGQQCATAAIEADRKIYNSIGERTIQQLHDVLLYLQNETMKLEAAYGSNFKKEATEKARAATEKMKEAVYAIKNIDRKRRGVNLTHTLGELECNHCGGTGDVSGEYPGIACPDCAGTGKAPQPAEPCASLMSDKTACGSKNGDCDSQPAEPVGEVLGETCIDGGKCHHGCKERCFRRQCCEPFSDYNGPWKYADEPGSPQPAEPVKSTCKKCNGTGVESTRFHGVWPNGEECLEPIKCDQCDGFGMTSAAEPVKVPSDDEIIELRSEFDWREHYGNIRFARALLARYGKGTP